MKHTLKQLKKAAREVRLSAEEKSLMREALVRHMEFRPVRNIDSSRLQLVKGFGLIPSPFSISHLRNKKFMPILAILGLLMSGSVSFAAENTVPGDVLYPVKVHVNETVRGAVAVTPQAKAQWDVRLVERRLEEVEKLAATPDALPEVKEAAQVNLEQYTDRVGERIAKFEEDEDGEDALKTAGLLAEVLSAHEVSLANLAKAGGSGATTLGVDPTASTTTLVAATSTTTMSATTPTDVASLLEVLSKLREVRGHAEEKHHELKKKYHEEDTEDNLDKDGDEGIPMNGTAGVTNGATVVLDANATGTVPVAGAAAGAATSASISQGIRIGDHEDAMRSQGEHQEEVRTALGAGASIILPTIQKDAERDEEEQKTERNND